MAGNFLHENRHICTDSRETSMFFAGTGLPEKVENDNGSWFSSEEVQNFMKKSGVRPITTEPGTRGPG